MTDLKKYLVHIAGDAKQMLDTHVTFLDKVSEDAVDRLVDSFIETTDSLQTLPERCPWYKGKFVPHNMYRYLLFEDRYALVFQINENVVSVDYVIDCRQDYGWLF